MPVYRLPAELVFPPPEEAEPNGLLAVGGDLSVPRLLLAYRMGIFPWYTEGDPILWWSPDPRLILEPSRLRISRSLKRTITSRSFTVSMDRAFSKVIQKCASVRRRGGTETWIVSDMIGAYTRLHRAGFAHSVEAWEEGQLAGGLYGVSLGGAFFGESMFAEQRDASKTALVYLASALQHWGIELIDCQITTRHLISMGAQEVSRADFLKRLHAALRCPTRSGAWMLPPHLQLPV